VDGEPFLMHRQTDRQTDMVKITVAFHIWFAKTHEHGYYFIYHYTPTNAPVLFTI
jgi:hypothetical protein